MAVPFRNLTADFLLPNSAHERCRLHWADSRSQGSPLFGRLRDRGCNPQPFTIWSASQRTMIGRPNPSRFGAAPQRTRMGPPKTTRIGPPQPFMRGRLLPSSRLTADFCYQVPCTLACRPISGFPSFRQLPPTPRMGQIHRKPTCNIACVSES